MIEFKQTKGLEMGKPNFGLVVIGIFFMQSGNNKNLAPESKATAKNQHIIRTTLTSNCRSFSCKRIHGIAAKKMMHCSVQESTQQIVA